MSTFLNSRFFNLLFYPALVALAWALAASDGWSPYSIGLAVFVTLPVPVDMFRDNSERTGCRH